ncbi:hypothetical protein BC833DRAFT_524853 [Globomyces pollinis-pini]|nr:hypothetical protein BC833DRAFT_524853 [Globomyces pollinis-pini]
MQRLKKSKSIDTRFQLTSDDDESDDSNDDIKDQEEELNNESNDDDDDGDELENADIEQMLQENLNSLKPNSLTEKNLKKFNEKIEKTGVCYLSRIPPFMQPSKLRSILTKYGTIGRIYLNPEDSKITARRKKYKHNKKINFVEGWIEFEDKKIARQVATLLNNTNIGGKKRDYYYDDIWNIKYLPKFKWNNLTEQLAYEMKVKEQRLRAEMSQAKRENSMYLKNVQKAKAIDAMETKKRKKFESGESTEAPTQSIRRKFRQRKVQEQSSNPPSDKKSSLKSKIFTN